MVHSLSYHSDFHFHLFQSVFTFFSVFLPFLLFLFKLCRKQFLKIKSSVTILFVEMFDTGAFKAEINFLVLF